MEKCEVCSEEYNFQKKDYRDGEILEHLYNGHEFTQKEISNVFDCSQTTIKTWFKKNDIQCSKYQYEISEPELKRLYVEEEKSIKQIAEYYGCSYCAVRNRMKNYNIEIRKPSELISPEDTEYRSPEKLKKLYHNEEKSIQEIADEYSVNPETIKHHLVKNDIERRNLSDAQKLRHSKKNKPYRDEEKLKELYIDKKLTTREIAERFGVSQICITSILNEYDVEMRYAGAGGETYPTNAGIYVRSSGERRIVNWFVENDIEFEYEPSVEISLIPDFIVDGVYIEYWGMVANDGYKERMAEKLEIYKKTETPLINLYPSDIENLDKSLSSFL